MTTDANGNASADATFPIPSMPATDVVTGTATNQTTGDTSEFADVRGSHVDGCDPDVDPTSTGPPRDGDPLPDADPNDVHSNADTDVDRDPYAHADPTPTHATGTLTLT